MRHLHAGHGVHGYIDFHARAPLAARPDMWAGPDRGRGARRLRLHPEGPRQRHRLPVDLRARQPQGVLRGAHGARHAAVVRHRRSRRSPWAERLDGAPARPPLLDRATSAFGRGRTIDRLASRRRARALLPTPTARPSGSATRVRNRDMAGRCGASPRTAPTSSIAARSPRRSPRTCARMAGCCRSTISANYRTRRQRAAVGRLSRPRHRHQPAAGRRRHAARDAEHPGEFRPRARSATTRRSTCASSPRR